MKKSDYYYKAVLWAVKNNVTAGVSKTAFAPCDTCTRGQIVTFLYRFVGSSLSVLTEPINYQMTDSSEETDFTVNVADGIIFTLNTNTLGASSLMQFSAKRTKPKQVNMTSSVNTKSKTIG